MGKRTPVLMKLQSVITVMGVDAGLASTGVSIVTKVGNNRPQVLHTELIQTKQADKKQRNMLRGAVDDQRRYREIYTTLENISRVFSIQAVGLEAYHVYGARAGNAWKTVAVFGGVIFWGFMKGMYVGVFTPADLKHTFCSKASASKMEVQKALPVFIDGFDIRIREYAKGKQEHITDATGHAYLILQEVVNNRILLGL